MYLHADKVKHAVECAQGVLEDQRIYAKDSTRIPVSIDSLHEVISELSGYTVEMREVSFEGTYLFGRIEKYDGKRAIIDVKSSLAENWKRFIACKELVHLLIDEEEDMSPYGDEMLEKLVRDGHIGVISNNGGDKPPMQSELIAEVTALEILYPVFERKKDFDALAKGETTIRKLALHYGLPDNFIDTGLSTDYLDFVITAIKLEKDS